MSRVQKLNVIDKCHDFETIRVNYQTLFYLNTTMA